MVARYLETTRGRRPAVILVRPARYDFRQLFDWKAAFFTSPPDVGMTRAGVCVRENQVCIGIAPGRGTAEALASADQLGIPRAALKLFEAAVIEVGEKPGTTPRRDGGTRRP
jgi:hypothetical protein